jgi:hypothetical protein
MSHVLLMSNVFQICSMIVVRVAGMRLMIYFAAQRAWTNERRCDEPMNQFVRSAFLAAAIEFDERISLSLEAP